MTMFEQFLKERTYIKNSSQHTIAFYRQRYQTYQRVLSEKDKATSQADELPTSTS